MLETKVWDRYKTLTDEEIKTLVIEDKWMQVLDEAIHTEMQRISQRLSGRISELAARLPRYYRHIGKVAYEHGRLGMLMQDLEDAYPDAELDRMDGLKLSWPDHWIHVRSSNTEPLLRLAVEAKNRDEAAALFAAVQEKLT